MTWRISIDPDGVRGVQSGGPPRSQFRSLRGGQSDENCALSRRGQDEDVDADVLVVGGGLAGLVTAGELLDAGRRVLLLDQERPADLGGQAYWSFGGLFLVDTPQQRRFGIRDSFDLAWQDWRGRAHLGRHWGGEPPGEGG